MRAISASVIRTADPVAATATCGADAFVGEPEPGSGGSNRGGRAGLSPEVVGGEVVEYVGALDGASVSTPASENVKDGMASDVRLCGSGAARYFSWRTPAGAVTGTRLDGSHDGAVVSVENAPESINAGLGCFDATERLRRRKIQKTRSAMSARATMPPTVPPAMAAVFNLLKAKGSLDVLEGPDMLK